MERFLRTLLELSLAGSLLAAVLTVLRPLLRGRVGAQTTRCRPARPATTQGPRKPGPARDVKRNLRGGQSIIALLARG